MSDVPIYTKAEMNAQLDRISALQAELETVKGELVRAWNAFGSPASRKDAPAWDVDDLEHLSRSANGGLDDQIRELEDQLSAAEAKLAGGEAVKVKPLEWVSPSNGRDTLERVETIVGVYRVWTHYEANGGWFWSLRGVEDVGGNSLNMEGAKVAAQADFERRILSALTHPAPTHEEEPPLEYRAEDWHEDGSGERHPLEAYADSYAQMARDGDGKVDCRSVEVDIRQNMMPATQALSHTSGEVTEAMVERMARWLANKELLSPDFDNGDGDGPNWRLFEDDARSALEAALRGDASGGKQ